MLSTTPSNTALKWIDAYNRHNIDQLIALYDEHATNVQLPWEKLIQGQEAIRLTYTNTFNAFPDIHIEAENLIEQGQWITLEWIFSGTMKGPFAGHAPNNNAFNMRGCEVFKIVNEKILQQHGYWDKSTLLKQLKLDWEL